MKRLYRTQGPDAILCGVCGGIARYFNVDPTVVRVATVLLVAFAGLSLWVYIVAALIMPKEYGASPLRALYPSLPPPLLSPQSQRTALWEPRKGMDR